MLIDWKSAALASGVRPSPGDVFADDYLGRKIQQPGAWNFWEFRRFGFVWTLFFV